MEQYAFVEGRIVREVTVGRRKWRSSIENRAEPSCAPREAWWQSFLRGATVVVDGAPEAPVRTVDVFSGCGGLSLGATQAALAAGRCLRSLAAVDVDEGCLDVHRRNFRTEHVLHASASTLVDFHVAGSAEAARFAFDPEVIDETLAAHVGSVDLLVAGPPCQGHSNLNNRTRRDDPRNLLYLTTVALAVGLRARAVVIENVPDVVNDRSDVVATARALLAAAGYAHVDGGVLAAHELGAAQTRRRFFLVASREPLTDGPTTLQQVAETMRYDPRPVAWAIGDLLDRPVQESARGHMDAVPVSSRENRERIEYLFRHDVYDLPDAERPDCHRNGHSYPSVYGRMHWDRPAQTITTGFLTPGRGRYVHPRHPRVITPREAARLQGFPDGFEFGHADELPARNALTKWIGDAVPPILGYAAALPLIAAF